MRPSEAVLVLAGRRYGATVGCTLTFSLSATVNKITPQNTIHCESPCYVEKEVPITVTNSFQQNATFLILLVEINGEFPGHGQSVKQLTNKMLPGGDDFSVQPKTSEIQLRAFFSTTQSVHIAAGKTETITVTFLSFSPGPRQCAVILADDAVGEMLYLVSANALLPLPETSYSDRLSSSFRSVQQLQCIEWLTDVGSTVTDDIKIPVRNVAKERALAVAAKLMLSDKELHRHIASGTLTSASVMSKTMELLSKLPCNQNSNIRSLTDTLGNNPVPVKQIDRERSLKLANCVYTVSLDNNKHFSSLSSSVVIPDFLNVGVCSPRLNDWVSLPVKFEADESGQYSTHIILRHGGVINGNGFVVGGDVRVFHLRCTVRPRGSRATIDFVSPVNQLSIQNIPIVNSTKVDWVLQACVEGDGFAGPGCLNAAAGTVTQYPLKFLPRYECHVQGKLTLVNSVDGVQHVFILQGKGDKPLPLDTLSLKMKVRDSIQQVISIPNMTKTTMHFRVESDIGFLSGAESLVVLAGQTGYYELQVRPLRRGHFKGILVFRADSELRNIDAESDIETSVSDEQSATSADGYYLWYAVDITVSPAEPQSTLSVTCPCQANVMFEVGVNNPTDADMALDVDLSGHGLQGPSQIILPPKAHRVYQATFSPHAVGVYTGYLSVFNELVGEVWYRLNLTAEPPKPTVLPSMECELGGFTQQTITLKNHGPELIHLVPSVSNIRNFAVEFDLTSPLALQPYGQLELPLIFVPSKLGASDQTANIIFKSVQLGDWVFTVSGAGLIPGTQQPTNITATLGDHSSVIIPFQNPTDAHILVDVSLQENSAQRLQCEGQANSLPFCLLLQSQNNIAVGPQATIQIPVSFLPQHMCTYQAVIVVAARREDGYCWDPVTPRDQNG
jgi:hypothetical protein